MEPNLRKIIENGRHVYETEHVSKDGKVISLEVNSRVINYLGQEAIISIARETTERKQLERSILSAVIKAEEKERERISRDIHDGLGPLLSTIKLYVNELESADLEPGEKKEMLKQTNEIINEAISGTRAISNNLSPHLIMDFACSINTSPDRLSVRSLFRPFNCPTANCLLSNFPKPLSVQYPDHFPVHGYHPLFRHFSQGTG